MNIRDLEYFNSLCITKSFTKTSIEFHISQPSITMALHRLENELNTKLIIRDHSQNQISLTESGKILRSHINNILFEIKKIKSEIARINGTKIRLGVPPIIGAYYFPIIMKNLIKNRLDKCFSLVETGSVTMKKLLIKDEVDMALIGSIEPLEDDIIKSYVLTTDEFTVCINKNNPLAKRNKIDFQELSGEKFISLGEGYVHNQVLKDLCGKNNISTKYFYHTDKIQTAKSLIASGFGVGLMVRESVKDMNDIKALSLREPITFYISLAFKKEHFMVLQEKEIIDIILKSSKN
ncbi:LysR family transcriptional regulator [Clostridium sp. Mt-5]|uniref:LysR family transcriptional regulator n=1 Tax=Clostridium moutaii TaxID=3240932 RepID=A0ABV4BT33_9CLOT